MTVPQPPLKKPITDNPETSFTLSSAYYLDFDLYEKEKEAIFYRTWQYVIPAARLPNVGDYQTFDICDERIFVIRSVDNELRAFYNVCRHRAHALLEGSGNKPNAIVCPYHAWGYRSDGQLISAPMSEDRLGFDRQDYSLKSIRLEVFCGCIFVNLDDSAEPLASMAAELESDIRGYVPDIDAFDVQGSNILGETHMEAGWKVVVDNFVECYHCECAHPDFASLIDMSEYRLDVFDYWSRQLGPRIRHENSAYPVSKDDTMQQAVFWYLWPNTTFNVMPGSLEMAVYAVRPVSHTSSRFEGEVLVGSEPSNSQRVNYTADILSPEDIALCESVQRGLGSRSYDQGPIMVDKALSGRGEQGLHHFHRLVHEALGADGVCLEG